MSIKLINTEERSSFSTKQTYCKKVHALKFAIAKAACTFSIFGQTKHTRHLSFQYFFFIILFDLFFSLFICIIWWQSNSAQSNGWSPVIDQTSIAWLGWYFHNKSFGLARSKKIFSSFLTITVIAYVHTWNINCKLFPFLLAPSIYLSQTACFANSR